MEIESQPVTRRSVKPFRTTREINANSVIIKILSFTSFTRAQSKSIRKSTTEWSKPESLKKVICDFNFRLQESEGKVR